MAAHRTGTAVPLGPATCRAWLGGCLEAAGASVAAAMRWVLQEPPSPLVSCAGGGGGRASTQS